MKDIIKDKFKNIKHKWIYFELDSKTFSKILNEITDLIKKGEYNKNNAMSLVQSFKFQEKVFVKFIKTVGRKNFSCLCKIIDKDNKKIEILLSPEEVISANILSDTPKSLKLYKNNIKTKGVWKKPDDGFVDPCNTDIPIEEELTELGYTMYKDWTEEVRASGMSSIDYYRKLNGTYKYYHRS